MHTIFPCTKRRRSLSRSATSIEEIGVTDYKADDGKIDLAEFWGAIGKMGEEMLPVVESIIRTEEEEEKRKETETQS